MSDRRLVMAYADPPYIGQSEKHYGDHPDYAGEVDHGDLIGRLLRDYPDGWALSLSVPSLHIVLDRCRDHGLSLWDGDIRLGSWVKPFAAFKRNVRVAYTLGADHLEARRASPGCDPDPRPCLLPDHDAARAHRRQARGRLPLAVRRHGPAPHRRPPRPVPRLRGGHGRMADMDIAASGGRMNRASGKMAA